MFMPGICAVYTRRQIETDPVLCLKAQNASRTLVSSPY